MPGTNSEQDSTKTNNSEQDQIKMDSLPNIDQIPQKTKSNVVVKEPHIKNENPPLKHPYLTKHQSPPKHNQGLVHQTKEFKKIKEINPVNRADTLTEECPLSNAQPTKDVVVKIPKLGQEKQFTKHELVKLQQPVIVQNLDTNQVKEDKMSKQQSPPHKQSLLKHPLKDAHEFKEGQVAHKDNPKQIHQARDHNQLASSPILKKESLLKHPLKDAHQFKEAQVKEAAFLKEAHPTVIDNNQAKDTHKDFNKQQSPSKRESLLKHPLHHAHQAADTHLANQPDIHYVKDTLYAKDQQNKPCSPPKKESLLKYPLHHAHQVEIHPEKDTHPENHQFKEILSTKDQSNKPCSPPKKESLLKFPLHHTHQVVESHLEKDTCPIEEHHQVKESQPQTPPKRESLLKFPLHYSHQIKEKEIHPTIKNINSVKQTHQVQDNEPFNQEQVAQGVQDFQVETSKPNHILESSKKITKDVKFHHKEKAAKTEIELIDEDILINETKEIVQDKEDTLQQEESDTKVEHSKKIKQSKRVKRKSKRSHAKHSPGKQEELTEKVV